MQATTALQAGLDKLTKPESCFDAVRIVFEAEEETQVSIYCGSFREREARQTL